MKKVHIVSCNTYMPGKTTGGYEINLEPSMTKPNESLTIKEIIKRYGQGMVPEQLEYPYLDEENLEKIDHYFAPGALDLTDITALAEQNRVLSEAVDAALKAKADEQKAEKAAKEEAEKEYRKRVEDYEQSKNPPEPKSEE